MRLKLYIEGIKQHLEDRGVVPYNPKYPVYMDEKNDVAYFPLWNISGQFVGYQRYNPSGAKVRRSNHNISNDDMKYYTYVTKENPEKNVSYISLYGLHTLDKRNYVFIVEGIFDAVKLIKQNQPVVAVLANHPKQLKPFFKALSKKVIAIEDNDDAGSKLANIAHISYVVPDPYKDLGEMSNDEVKKFLKTIKGIKLS